MSVVRYDKSDHPERIMGQVIEQTWTTIAADQDSEVLTEEIGRRRRTLSIKFALWRECDQWISDLLAVGWKLEHGPTSCATSYFGETDSPSNCWSAEVSMEID